MDNLLELIYEYQTLHALQKHEELSEGDRGRLLGLRALLRGGSGDKSADNRPRLESPMSVQFTVPGGFATGELRSLLTLGMAVVTSQPAAVGTRTMVRVTDVARSVDYVFPGRVAWRTVGGKSLIGIAFDGVPSKEAALGYAWNNTLRFGEPMNAPMVA